MKTQVSILLVSFFSLSVLDVQSRVHSIKNQSVYGSGVKNVSLLNESLNRSPAIESNLLILNAALKLDHETSLDFNLVNGSSFPFETCMDDSDFESCVKEGYALGYEVEI